MEHTNFANPLLQKALVIVKASADTSYRIIETLLQKEPRVEARWHSDTIEALADIFFSKPQLLIVFEDSNDEGFAFLELVRNNSQFRELPAFLVLPEPLKWKHKIRKSLGNTERLSTPIQHKLFFEELTKILTAHPQ